MPPRSQEMGVGFEERRASIVYGCTKEIPYCKKVNFFQPKLKPQPVACPSKVAGGVAALVIGNKYFDIQN